MNTIKGFFINFIFALLFMALSIVIMPLYVFASSVSVNDFNLDGFEVDVENLSSFSGSNAKILITGGSNSNGVPFYGMYPNVSGLTEKGNASNVTGFPSVRLGFYYNPNGLNNKPSFKLYFQSGNSFAESSGYKYYYIAPVQYYASQGDLNYYCTGKQFSENFYLNSSGVTGSGILLYTNIPIFSDREKLISYLIYGTFDPSDIKNGELLDNLPFSGSLGVIKPKYSANGSDTTASTFREYIEWDKLSTSGFDVSGPGVGVQFAIKDKSYYHNHRLGEPSNLYDFIYSRVSWLASNVYPYGSSKRSWLQGESTNSSLYGKMRVIGEARGSDLQYGFSAWSFYANQNVDSKLSTFGNALLNNNTSSIIDTVMVTSDANASVCLSYDIYARIHDGGGQRYGNWLKINKHSVPVDQQSNRLNGGLTKEPVVIPGFNPSNDDWFDTDDETPSDDPDDEDDDPLPTGINDPNDGSPTYIYNNYTYNYDNRTWIENHYDNQTVDDVNTALDWIKLFPRFFGLFMTFFGTFLPGWAAVCVTIFVPILCGLLVFKVIKGVIPFV